MSSKTIKPEKQYRVKLARPVELVPGHWVRSGDDLVIAGAILAEIKDSAESYQEV